MALLYIVRSPLGFQEDQYLKGSGFRGISVQEDQGSGRFEFWSVKRGTGGMGRMQGGRDLEHAVAHVMHPLVAEKKRHDVRRQLTGEAACETAARGGLRGKLLCGRL